MRHTFGRSRFPILNGRVGPLGVLTRANTRAAMAAPTTAASCRLDSEIAPGIGFRRTDQHGRLLHEGCRALTEQNEPQPPQPSQPPEVPSTPPPPSPESIQMPPPPPVGASGAALGTPVSATQRTPEERRAILAQQLQHAAARQLRVESSAEYQAVLIEGKPINHT